MSKRDVRLFLHDMLEAIEKTERYTARLSYEQFEASDMVVDAVVRNLEIVGEAARQIPPNLRERYPAVNWARVVGFRNIVIHEYFDVDREIVWTIATQRLAELRTVLQQMLEDKETIMSQPVKLIALLKAVPGMIRAEFEKRWVEDHAPLALKFKNLAGYRINIAIDEYQEIEGELPYDGTAELWWNSLEEMQEDFASAEAATAVADADTFTVVRTHIYTREHILK